MGGWEHGKMRGQEPRAPVFPCSAMSRHLLLALSCATLIAPVTAQHRKTPARPPAQAAPPALPSALSTLKTAHPRLLVPDADLPRIWAALAADARLREWRERIRVEGTAIVAQPVVVRGDAGSGLLDVSRTAARRITTLAGLFRLDGDRKWLTRAVEEMRAVAAMPDWNPAYFLDTAGMTAALAIGYDWLYGDLGAEDRARFLAAIRDKGLAPGAELISRGVAWAVEPRPLWTEGCLSGLALGALAVAEDAPVEAAAVIDSLKGPAFRRRLAAFGPDGVDASGIGYWDHSTAYIVQALSALTTALGGDLDLGDTPGLSGIGQFRMAAIGPSGSLFNYADAREHVGAAPQMLWLARRYDRPEFAAHERAWLRQGFGTPTILHVLWAPLTPAREATAPPSVVRFGGVEMALLRGDWRDPMASWVGFKGGQNSAQSHLDLGNFVLDVLGERWAVDLGADDFSLPGYFGAERFSYVRTRTDGHNTLVVNGQNQVADARAPLVVSGDDGYRAFAVADLTAAYAPAVARARRGVMLVDGHDVLVQDEVEGAASADVVWQMLTRAAVSVAGGRAWLYQDGRRLGLQVVEPADATFTTATAEAPPPQSQQPDVTILSVRVPSRRESVRVVVWMSSGDRPPPAVSPLDEWKPASQ